MMSQVGCSGRACHGSFQGRDGFRLSLFGYDFAEDHKALTGGEKPRINKDDPDDSLVLLKPTLSVKHKRKQVLEDDGWRYNIIRQWIVNGAKEDSEQVGQFIRLEVQPREIIFTRPAKPRRPAADP